MSDLEPWCPPSLPVDVRRALEAAYGDGTRGYHDLLHLTEVLAHVDELMAADDPSREAVLLAGH